MPPVNPVIVSAGFIAISVAVVAAIAVYENPEVRRMADDLRRRIAVAMQSINDTVTGEDSRENRGQNRNGEDETEPVFNRPEDAEGFMLSRGRRTADDPGVVADDESRRRQREELLYWNRMQMERKKEEERKASALEQLQKATRDAAAAAGIHLPTFGGPASQPRSKTSFDQFMRPDHNATDRGTFVVNTGSDFASDSQVSSAWMAAEDPLNSGMLRRRRPAEGGVRGLRTAAVYANPFGDEYGIEMDDHDDYQTTTMTSNSRTGGPTAAEAFNSEAYLIAPDRDETMSDIYSATEPDTTTNNNNNNVNNMDAVFDPLPSIAESQQTTRSEVFFDVNDYAHETEAQASPATLAAAEVDSQLSLRLFRKPEDSDGDDNDEVLTREDATQNQVNTEAYNSIQAWAQNTSNTAAATTNANSLPGFYSPLPVTPSVGMSEPSIISGGDMTPTGSMSIWGDDHSVIDHNDANDARTDASSEIVQVQAQVAAAPSVPSTTPSSSAAVSIVNGGAASDYGVLSEADNDSESEGEGEGVMTPTSWSEVGSVVSESDAGMHAVHS